MNPDEFISLTSIDDGHKIRVRYPLLRSIEERQTESGLPFCEVRMCGGIEEPFYVMESADRIFAMINQQTIVSLAGDPGIVVRDSH